MKIYNTYIYAQKMNTTQANLQQAQNALEAYFLKNKVYPCPSSPSAPLDSAGFGQNKACAAFADVPSGVYGAGGTPVHMGALPARVLGLPDKAALDGWGNRIFYAVTDLYTPLSAPPQITMTNGAIAIRDSNLNWSTYPSASAIYAVVAPGPDNRGAYTANGAKPVPCPDPKTVQAGMNCNNSASFNATFIQTLNRVYDTASSGTFTSTMVYQAGPAVAASIPTPPPPLPPPPPPPPVIITGDAKVSAWTSNNGLPMNSDWTPSNITLTAGHKFNITVNASGAPTVGAPNPMLKTIVGGGAWTQAQENAYANPSEYNSTTGWNNAANCTGGFYGPNGRPCNPINPTGGELYNPLGHVADGTLIAKIGVNGAPFVVGANPGAMTANASGKLYFIMNDYQFSNNWGYQQVHITSTK